MKKIIFLFLFSQILLSQYRIVAPLYLKKSNSDTITGRFDVSGITTGRTYFFPNASGTVILNGDTLNKWAPKGLYIFPSDTVLSRNYTTALLNLKFNASDTSRIPYLDKSNDYSAGTTQIFSAVRFDTASSKTPSSVVVVNDTIDIINNSLLRVKATSNNSVLGAFSLALNRYGSNTGSQIIGRSANGTLALPTKTSSGDRMLSLLFSGYLGTGSQSSDFNAIDIVAGENWTSASNASSLIRFLSNSSTASGRARAFIGVEASPEMLLYRSATADSAALGFSISTTAPTYTLAIGSKIMVRRTNIGVAGASDMEFASNFLTNNNYRLVFNSNGDFVPFSSGLISLGYASNEFDSLYVQDIVASNSIKVTTGLSTFDGLNTGTVTVGAGDSVQVTITGITSSAIVSLTYNEPNATVPTKFLRYKVWATNTLSIYGDNTLKVAYWVSKK